MQKKTKASFIKGFDFAWQGIIWNFWNERNMRFHLIASVIALIFGLFFKISVTEWLILTIFFALIPALELVNSAVEATCDVLRDRLRLDYAATKLPRDLAAGAVLWAAIFAAIAGLIIFLPKITAFFTVSFIKSGIAFL